MTGGSNRTDKDSRPDEKEATKNKDVCPILTPAAGKSKAEVMADPNSLEAQLLAATRRVEDMVSNPGGGREDFDRRVGNRMNELMAGDSARAEYRAAYHERAIDDGNGGKVLQYGYAIQTAGTPLVSVAKYGMSGASGSGWKYDRSRDLHTHGMVRMGYAFSAVDELYSKGYSMPVTAGQKATREHSGMSDRLNFSPADFGNRVSRLVRPKDISAIRLDANCNPTQYRELKLK